MLNVSPSGIRHQSIHPFTKAASVCSKVAEGLQYPTCHQVRDETHSGEASSPSQDHTRKNERHCRTVSNSSSQFRVCNKSNIRVFGLQQEGDAPAENPEEDEPHLHILFTINYCK